VGPACRSRCSCATVVFASYFFGTPLDLIFTPFEVAAVTISVLIVGFVAMDGDRTGWKV